MSFLREFSYRIKKIRVFSRKWRLHHRYFFSEAHILVASFLGILLPSAFCLTLSPFSKVDLSFIDALFMATSAMTVTGLGVVDTGQTFTIAGQVWLLALMEIGGLGQMTFSSVLVFLLGARLSLRQRSLAKSQFNITEDIHIKITDLIRKIVIFSFVCQCVGVVFLSFAFIPEFGWGEGLYVAVFHAISAFNNAGFSVFSNSLIDYRLHPLVIFPISALIIIGGLGFTVIVDLLSVFRSPSLRRLGVRARFRRLQLHSKVMLIGTPMLIMLGMVFFWLIERKEGGNFVGLSLYEQGMLSFFQSVTARTAGFASMDIGKMLPASICVMIMLMFIGAGSTSAAGGVKISTVFVAMSAALAFLRQKDYVTLFHRTVNWSVVNRAFAMIVISSLIISVAVFLLLLTETATLDLVLFEVVSAMSTVGLTMGITDKLTEYGRLIIIVVMIIGRVGPITVMCLITKASPTPMRFAEGRVLVS